MDKLPLQVGGFILFIMILACEQREKPSTLVIAAASNVQFAMEEIKESFVQQTGVPCEVVLGSSGKLTAQIAEGAPYDVFVSADLAYPTDLFNRGISDQPKVYARGQLILWTAVPQHSIRDIQNPDVIHIAMANPQTAPYGKAAIQLTNRLNIYQNVREKLVFGESISQVNQFIKSGAVQAAFTSKSVVLSPSFEALGYWFDLEDYLYDAIDQGVVVIKNSPMKKEALRFREFMLSKKSQDILRKFGYEVETRKTN